MFGREEAPEDTINALRAEGAVMRGQIQDLTEELAEATAEVRRMETIFEKK